MSSSSSSNFRVRRLLKSNSGPASPERLMTMTHKRSVMPSLSEFRSRQTMDDRTTTAQGNVGRRTVKKYGERCVIPLSLAKRAMHRPSQCMHSLLIDGERLQSVRRGHPRGDSNDQIESDARIRVRGFGRIGSSGQPNPLQKGGTESLD